MDNKSLGGFIAQLRKEKGFTQKQLAEFLNVSDKTVSHWECDETSPDISLLPQLSQVLGVTVDELLKGEKAIPQPTVEHHYIPPKKESIFDKAGNFALRIFKKVKSKMSGDITEKYRYFRMLSLVGTVIACVVIIFVTLVNFIAGNYFLSAMAFIPGIVAFIGSLWILVISVGFTLVARLAFYKHIYPLTEANEQEKKYIYKANNVSFSNLFLVFSALPLSLTGYQDILGYAVILNVLIAIICLAVLYVVLMLILNKKGILRISKKKMLIIKTGCISFVLIAIGITAGLLIQELWQPMPENIIFESADEFIAYMETPAEKPENAYILEGAEIPTYPPTMPFPDQNSTTESSVNQLVEENETASTGITVMGYCGEDYVTFRHLNKSVYDFTYNEDTDTFYVITYEAKIKSEMQFDMRDDILSVILPYYCVPVVMISFLACKKKIRAIADDD